MSSYRDVIDRSRAQYRPEPGGFERLRRRRDRKRRNERIAAATLALVLFAAVAGVAVRLIRSGGEFTPAAPTVTIVKITDPVGDDLIGVGYQDIASAAVSRSGVSFTFSLSLSSGVPSTLEVPAPYDALGYEFCLDTDRSVSPVGYPFATATAAPCEFIVETIVRPGGRIEGLLIDRRPLGEGRDAVTSSIAVTLDGADIVASVPVDALEAPGSFTWVVYATELTLPLGNDDFVNVDQAPDTAAEPWPSG